MILLVGGTDGGDAEVLLHNAGRLASARVRVPVVVAGNADARDEVCALLAARGARFVATDNVLPRIGVLNPVPARAAIREVFLHARDRRQEAVAGPAVRRRPGPRRHARTWC